jgi:hypothetical protein
MRQFWREHEKDSLSLLATLCILGAGALTGIGLAHLALSW